jgi:hypothetical protein
LGIFKVFNTNWYAGQGSWIDTVCDELVYGSCLLQRLFVIDGDEGIDRGVERIDAFKTVVG